MDESKMKSTADRTIKKKNTTRFLIFSLILMIFVSVASMSFFAFTVSEKSEEAISDVGDLYMHGMSERISDHFETTINLRIAQVETIVKNSPPEDIVSGAVSIEDIGK